MKLLEKLITKPKKLQRILGLQKEQLRLLIARMSPSWETDWAMGNIFKKFPDLRDISTDATEEQCYRSADHETQKQYYSG